MRVLQINTVYGSGSTGRIMMGIHDACVQRAMECRCAHRGSQKALVDEITVGTQLDSRIHGFLARITLLKGCFSYRHTKRFLKKVKQYQPDVIHLHNLHGSYINLPLLFRYIKKNDIPVVWTLHDCWPFTAICSHFTLAQCNKWKTGCGKCPQRKTPSNWLAGLVKQSFLKEYLCVVIPNGIDLEVFRPRTSDFRQKYGLENKKIVLGVAFDWSERKGVDIFCRLREMLDNDYAIVLVGTSEAIDVYLPEGIISIHRTNSPEDLAKIYSAADVFVNPTREEVLGLVNLESIACGTPVVTFATGGSPECVNEKSGRVVPCEDVMAMKQEILNICEHRELSGEECIAVARDFDVHKMFEGYVKLYEKSN